MTKNINFKLLAWSLGCVVFLMACGTPTVNTTEQDLAITVKNEVQPSHTTIPEKTIESIVMDSSISNDYLIGKFNPASHPDFIEMDTRHASDKGMYLRKDAYEAFIKMYTAAKADGVDFKIRSATRNFDRQKVIWEGKWNGERLLEGNENAKTQYPVAKDRALKILEYSSMPGTSRHHWGTDIDLNAFVNSYFEKGKGLKEYEWLSKHASTYGFCQPYTPKGSDRPHGYNEEKWHWSYLPVAHQLTQQFKLRLGNDAISGFDGAETAAEIDVVQKYVLGINEACLSPADND